MSTDAMDRLIGRVDRVHTGGMVALIPSAADAERLALPGWEPPDALHVTLRFLGDASMWGEESKEGMRDVGHSVARMLGTKFVANAWASAAFNPTSSEPCATYLVGGPGVAAARDYTEFIFEDAEWDVPEQHVPWIPHISIGYGLDSAALNEFGPITFDRVRVAFGDLDKTDFYLN